MNLKILGKRLLIEPLYDEHKGLVAVPEVAAMKKWNRNTGILRAFGKQALDEYPDLKKGMTICFKPYGGQHEIELNNKTFLLVDTSYVLGIGEVE